jgi:hypothetical protein
VLYRCQFPIPNDKCVVCNQSRETKDHLFYECDLSKACWSILGINWDCSLNLSDRINVAASVWSCPLFLEHVIIGAWNIWKQRNRKYFDNITPTTQTWLAKISVDSDLLSCRVNTTRRDSIKSFVSSLRI